MREVVLAGQDSRPAGRRGEAFRPAWVFKGDAVERIGDMLAGVEGPVVHACAGAAVIPGEDLRVDLYHPSADHAWDVMDLDRHIQDVGAIVCDPPYAWDLGRRQAAINACVRALRPGGVLIWHAPWQPRCRTVLYRREPFYLREDAGLMGWPQPFVILAAYDKTRDPRVLRRWKPRPPAEQEVDPE